MSDLMMVGRNCLHGSSGAFEDAKFDIQLWWVHLQCTCPLAMLIGAVFLEVGHLKFTPLPPQNTSCKLVQIFSCPQSQ